MPFNAPTGGGGGSGGASTLTIPLIGDPLTAAYPNAVVVGSTVPRITLRYDDTTPEFVFGCFLVPAGIDANSTLRLVAAVSAVTGAEDKNCRLRFEHCQTAGGEAWDGSFTAVDSADVPLDDSAANLTIAEWTVANATAGWEAKRLVCWRFSRQAASEDDLAADLAVHAVALYIEPGA